MASPREGGALKSILSAALSCQPPSAYAATIVDVPTSCSTAPSTPVSSPDRKNTTPATSSPSPLRSGSSAKQYNGGGGRRQRQQPNHGRKDPPYRHRHNNVVSPTVITLNRRSATLPTATASFSPPLLPSSGAFDSQRDAAPRGSAIVKKHRSEGHTRDEDLGVERKLVAVSRHHPPRKDSGQRNNKNRGRASSCPEVMPPLEGVPTTDKPAASATGKDGAHHPGPTKGAAPPFELFRDEVVDAERLLSQMGMHVTEEDYCIEGEFGWSRIRAHYGNYDSSPENAHEAFGTEGRTPDELKRQKPPSREEKRPRGKNKIRTTLVGGVRWLVGSTVGNIGANADGGTPDGNDGAHARGRVAHDKSRNNDGRVQRKGSRILSILRCGNGRNDEIPDQIVATTITPASSGDAEECCPMDTAGEECPMTLDDMRLLYRWQIARARSGADGVDAVRGSMAAAFPGGRRSGAEDVLSITSSCGDKTAPVNNRRRHHRPGFSF